MESFNQNLIFRSEVLDTIGDGFTTTKTIYSNTPFFRGSSILSRPYKWWPNEPPLQIARFVGAPLQMDAEYLKLRIKI
jgi:hypothetical protein